MFGQMAKWVAQIDRVERIPEYIARAYQTATSGRPGPVVLALPEDMLTQEAAVPQLAAYQRVLSWPGDADIERLSGMLAAAERPFALIGGSGWTPQACAQIQQFAERFALPVGCAFRGQDLFDNRHPNYAGDVGIGINPALAERIRHADLVLAIGPRLGEMTTGGYALISAPRPAQQLIHVHAGAEELGSVYQADLMIHASMPAIAARLAALPSPAMPPRWQGWTQDAHTDYERYLTPPAYTGQGVDMAEVVRTLDRLLPADAVVTNGAGNYAGWLHRYFRYRPFAAAGAGSSRDQRSDGLWRAGRRGCEDCFPAAHRRGAGRRWLFPDERARAGNGHAVRRAGGIHRREQRHVWHDPHAPGARVSGPCIGHRAAQPGFCGAGAGLWGARRDRDDDRGVRACAARGTGRAGLHADRDSRGPRRDHPAHDAQRDSRAGTGQRQALSRGALTVPIFFMQEFLMKHVTTDLCDANEPRLADGTLRVMAPVFRAFGKQPAFAGQAATLKIFEDNSLVREALESPGQGRVLVVDGGGSLRCALVGGNLGLLAEKNGWVGIVVNGCVRDTGELDVCDIGIRALAAHPQKSQKRGAGERDVAVQMPGAVVRPGNWIYVDADGVLVSEDKLEA